MEDDRRTRHMFPWRGGLFDGKQAGGCLGGVVCVWSRDAAKLTPATQATAKLIVMDVRVFAYSPT